MRTTRPDKFAKSLAVLLFMCVTSLRVRGGESCVAWWFAGNLYIPQVTYASAGTDCTPVSCSVPTCFANDIIDLWAGHPNYRLIHQRGIPGLLLDYELQQREFECAGIGRGCRVGAWHAHWDRGGEAPVAFHWHDYYWLLRDIGRALALYRSEDAKQWQRVGTLLGDRGTGPDDTGVGHHADVILSCERAYLFYFVQPGTSANPGGPADGRRSSIQVTELKYDAVKHTLTVDRNAPTIINLQPPKDVETESKVD